MKTETTYKTQDGREYTNEKDALKHERLNELEEKYDNAKTNYAKALWETQNTADGKPFDLGVWKNYYYVSPGYFGKPTLREIHFYVWSMHLDEDDILNIRYHEDTTNGRQWTNYKISDLYSSKLQAEYALVDALREWLQERTEEINEYIKNTLPQPAPAPAGPEGE